MAPVMKKELLLYNLDNEKGKQIQAVCSPLQIVCRHVQPDEYLQLIGSLAGMPGFPPKPRIMGPTFNEEMMVLCGFDNDSIYTFLDHYKKAGIAPVWLKAALTPNNLQWNSLQMHDELMKEHQQMKGSRS